MPNGNYPNRNWPTENIPNKNFPIEVYNPLHMYLNLVVETDEWSKVILKTSIDKNMDAKTLNLHNCEWKSVNDIRLHVFKLKKNHTFSRQ